MIDKHISFLDSSIKGNEFKNDDNKCWATIESDFERLKVCALNGEELELIVDKRLVKLVEVLRTFRLEEKSVDLIYDEVRTHELQRCE